MKNDLFTCINPTRVKVGNRGDSVEILVDDNYSITISAAEARGLALKLVLMSALPKEN